MIKEYNVNIPRGDKWARYMRNEAYNDISLFKSSDTTTCEIDLEGRSVEAAYKAYLNKIKCCPEFAGIVAITRNKRLYLLKGER